MKRILIFLPLAMLLASGCRHSAEAPDVSGIKVNVKVERFDKDLFALDSTRLPEQWPGIVKKYPNFSMHFLQDVLALGPAADSPRIAYSELRHFLAQNEVLKDSVFLKFSSMDPVTDVLNNYFRYVKYYYPDYNIPTIIAFIGNFGGREIFTQDGLGIGLDFYMGPGFSYYQIPEVQEVYPSYVTHKFSLPYLPVNVMKAVVGDLYPGTSDTSALIDQIIEQGRRLYLVDKFLPGVDDTLKLGYTGRQYAWCKANEGLIWTKGLVEQEVLYSMDPDVIKNYMGEAPSTQTMDAQSPGAIGDFVGWQIVRRYLSHKGDPGPKKLMELGTREILGGAQYNPK